jgi:hypothetical protein
MSVTAVLSFRDAHILIRGLQLNSLRTAKESLSHISRLHLFTTLKRCTACVKPNPRQGNFVIVFTWSPWLVPPIAWLLTALTMFWIYKRSYKPTNVSECFLVVWPLTLGLSAPQMAQSLPLYCWVLQSRCLCRVTCLMHHLPGGAKIAGSDFTRYSLSGIMCPFAPFDGGFWCHAVVVHYEMTP